MFSADELGYEVVKTRRKSKQMTENDIRAIIKKQKKSFQKY